MLNANLDSFLFWGLPYLLALLIYLGLWLYCRVLYQYVRLRVEQVKERLRNAPDSPYALKEFYALADSMKPFPECLLFYRAFTFPDEPLSLAVPGLNVDRKGNPIPVDFSSSEGKSEDASGSANASADASSASVGASVVTSADGSASDASDDASLANANTKPLNDESC